MHGASLRGWAGAASWFRVEMVGARLGGRGVALRPLRTWNGEGASGEEVRQGPEGEPLSRALGGQCWALEAASHRLAGEGIW